MSMFGLPDLLHQVGVDVGDLEYIEGKVTANNYFQVSGDIDALNDTIEFIPASGKTAFLIEAKIVITGHVTPAGDAATNSVVIKNEVEAELKINSVTKDTTNLGFSSQGGGNGLNGRGSGTGYGHTGNGRFNVLGLSLAGDGAKKIEIVNTLDNGSAFATMSGYLV